MTYTLTPNPTAPQERHHDEPVYFIRDDSGRQIGTVTNTMGVWIAWRGTECIAADCDFDQLRRRLGRRLSGGTAEPVAATSRRWAS